MILSLDDDCKDKCGDDLDVTIEAEIETEED